MTAWRWVLGTAGVVAVLVSLPTLYAAPGATYASHPALLPLEAAAALALVLAAAVGAVDLRRTAMLTLVGATWLVPDLAGTPAVGLGARTLADAWTHVLLALLTLALVPSQLASHRLHRRARVLLIVGTGASIAAAAARVLLVDPFLDERCWRSCAHNPLALPATATWGGQAHDLLVLVSAASLGTGVLLVWRADRRGVPLAGLSLVGLALVGGMLAGSVGRLLAREDVGSLTWRLWFCLVQVAALALLGTRLWEAWQRRVLAARLSALVGVAGPGRPTGGLVAALRVAVRDPALTVAYHAPVRGALVDVDGQAVRPPSPGPGRAVTTLTRAAGHGKPAGPVAVVQHAARIDGDRLRRALGPALTLALVNEQLRAASLAELDELRRSRARVVERAALERSRLERNLHDGAQQGVVALSLLVRVLGQRVEGRAPAGVRERAEALCAATVAELRRVARGLYPAVLADAGLSGALVELAESSADLPVVVAAVADRRCSGTVETTAYLMAQEMLEDARRRRATQAVVASDVQGATLRLLVEDDAAPGAPEIPTPVLDQVAALGGRWEARPHGTGTRSLVELPCAS